MALPVLLPAPAVSGEIFVTPSAGSVQPVSQGAAASVTAPWPVELSNGANQVGTPTAPLSVQPGTGVVTPVSATQLPAALGQTNKAGSTSVAIASDDVVSVTSTQLPAALGPQAQAASLSTVPATAPASYSASILNLVPAGLATDIFTIIGSASKVVQITRIEVSGTQTTAGEVPVQLVKRSAADTGGTHTAPVAVPLDSANAAATAVVTAYTANPTALGTLVGAIRSKQLQVNASAADYEGDATWEFGTRPAQAVTLRGVAETLAVNLNGVTVTGGSFSINIEWTES